MVLQIDGNKPYTLAIRKLSEVVLDSNVAEALHLANIELMMAGISVFSYKKKTGGLVRVAIGTINPNYVPMCDKAQYNLMIELIKEMVDKLALNVELNEEQIATLRNCANNLVSIEDKGEGKTGNIQHYFDLQAQAWRSYDVHSILAIFEHR